MSLSDFYRISLRENGDTTGLVWSGEVQENKYFAELQTGVVPQLVHLVIFDMEDDNKPVYTTLQAFELGDTVDASVQAQIQEAVAEGLAVLNA